jgi:putative ABC transport system permease protein
MGEKDVILATPQITLSGIVSNGSVSTIFIAQGVIPQDDKTIKGGWNAFRPVQGEGLNEKKTYGVEMAQDLAKFLNLEPGKDGVVMAPTMSGQMNAMDIQVSGVFDTGTDATNDKYMRFPFVFAQSLLDTEKAEKIVVLLEDTAKTELMRIHLLSMLANAGIPCEIKTWKELSMFYAKVRQMFGVFFLFVFCIVLVIVVMSTVNTMGMAVLERTREIGTLRALGLKRRGVSTLFAMEGSLLGVFGSLIGIVLHTCAWSLINVIKPTYTYPGSSTPVPLEISFVPETLLGLMCCLTVLSLAAAIIPARRAARQNIVNALGHT